MTNPNSGPLSPVETEVASPPEPFAAPVQITSAPTLDGVPTETKPAPSVAAGRPGDPSRSMGDRTSTTPTGATSGEGLEGEEVVWEAGYSLRNFIGRLALRVALSLGWVAAAVYTWGYRHEAWFPFTLIYGLFLVFLWGTLAYRMALARYGHHYRLTTRRLFVSSGLMRRRKDQMELARVKDVFVRQTLPERWQSLGSVVVVSSERDLPAFHVAGIDDPSRVMDLIWHHARAERERHDNV